MSFVQSRGVGWATTNTALLTSEAPAFAGHEHLVKITNPQAGDVTCRYKAWFIESGERLS